MDTLAHTHGCVQAWPYVACSYSVWRGISMPHVLGCRVLACVGYRPLDGLLAGVTHRPGDYITLWSPSWTLEGFTTELQYILYHTITVGIGDHLHRVLSVCNACMNHKITFAAHEDLRETFSKTLRYRVTNLSLQFAWAVRRHCQM